jgi:hypothetical protein
VTTRGFKFAAVPVVMLSLVTATVVTWTSSACASGAPPVVVRNPRPVVHAALGGSFTFKASATDAATVVWVVRSPDGSSFSTYGGDNTLTKRGLLKSSFTFGPVTASENGSEVAASFVNDPGCALWDSGDGQQLRHFHAEEGTEGVGKTTGQPGLR